MESLKYAPKFLPSASRSFWLDVKLYKVGNCNNNMPPYGLLKLTLIGQGYPYLTSHTIPAYRTRPGPVLTLYFVKTYAEPHIALFRARE